MIPSGTFRRCFRIVVWIPVLVVTSVVIWSYYAYVVQLCIFTLNNTSEKVVYVLMFHVCFGMFLWAYWKTMFTPPSPPSKKFHLSYSDRQRYDIEDRPEGQQQILMDISRNLPVFCRSASGAIRFCHHCQVIKPDRCHHCSACEMCVLKMDHHCPWLNNCVGFSNYKFFLLFLVYSLLYCFFVAVTTAPYSIKYWVGELPYRPAKLHVLFLMLVSLMFFVTLSFLLGFHCWLVARNRSTLESLLAPFFPHGPDRSYFNVGARENFLEVFGDDKRLWLLPVFSSKGDGQNFPMRSKSEAQNSLLANEGWKEAGSDVECGGLQRSLPDVNRNGATVMFPELHMVQNQKIHMVQNQKIHMVQPDLASSLTNKSSPPHTPCTSRKQAP
ncbi:palmitoyltransferase ZDHHC15B-like isoform X2 [Hypomesus transpacificus]|uniref:palmitoyltransferase ZDHHC15B-like isoform X2 n=1 Tax=Hypomesus transpacificus TaxID=137520 RepID=UPI001F08016B|nr:palmitoyltransferase ZDHHC15B-like isoform X2 [Hypomesus transpacificus]